jgi:thiamine pyrophosphate-dependent acetolactate synthase large subunit-like protein
VAGAVGAALARPDRVIVAPSGDGSALYALATLWTAVHLNLKVVFVVCNNGTYRILKINLLHHHKTMAQAPGDFPHMDISPPRINFASLAKGFGMPSVTVRTADELARRSLTPSRRTGPC